MECARLLSVIDIDDAEYAIMFRLRTKSLLALRVHGGSESHRPPRSFDSAFAKAPRSADLQDFLRAMLAEVPKAAQRGSGCDRRRPRVRVQGQHRRLDQSFSDGDGS